MARVGERALTVEEVAREVRSLGSAAVRRYDSKPQMRKFVEDQVRFELLVRAAGERGLHRDPEVISAARKVMVRKLLQRDLGHTAFPQLRESAVERYYERHRDEYVQPEKRRFSHIQLAPTEAGRVLAQALIERLAESPEDPSLFANLKAKHSLKITTRRLGLDDLFQAQQQVAESYGPSFAAELFSAPTNAVIGHPVQSTQGWHVVKLLAVREALTRPLEDVRTEILEKLQRGRRSEAFDKYLNDLKKRFPVAIYEARLPQVIDAIDALPPDPPEYQPASDLTINSPTLEETP